jgi:DNA-binding GntR family transcriptional regulator
MPPTRFELALRYLRKKLQHRELLPGERLSDFSLAKEMGISRTPVREAIKCLVAAGLAESIPHAGVFVKALTRAEVEELYELREALESFAAAKVADHKDELGSAIDELAETCDTMRKLEEMASSRKWSNLPKDQTLEHHEADLTFHTTLVLAAGNRRITKAMADSDLHTRLFASMDPRTPVVILRRALRWHQEVLDAIKQGDSSAARAAMARHIHVGLEERLAEWDDGKHRAHAYSDVPPALQSVADEG